MVMDKARWQAAPRGVSKRHSLMALRILTPMGREPQKLFISREVHGSTVPFFFRQVQSRPLKANTPSSWGMVNQVYAANDTVTWSVDLRVAAQRDFFFTLFLSFSLLVPDPKADRSPQAVQDLRS